MLEIANWSKRETLLNHQLDEQDYFTEFAVRMVDELAHLASESTLRELTKEERKWREPLTRKTTSLIISDNEMQWTKYLRHRCGMRPRKPGNVVPMTAE